MMKAIIAVPIYKEFLNSAELISLQQLFKILGRHDICFIMPESSNFSMDGFHAMQERFADKYFVSTMAYSELVTSEIFYQRFSFYDYVLIYQLDAFVFTDRLAEFCALGYDYIGAPVPIHAWPSIKQRVGNGGFSLRKIQSVLRLLTHRQEILAKAREEFSDRFYNSLLTTEDIFFAYSGNLSEYEFHLAPEAIAGDFSVEYDIRHSLYAGIHEHLPFGCHRWYEGTIDFWRPHIEAFGYDVSTLVEQGLAWGEGRRIGAYAYLLQRLARASKESIRRAIANFLPERAGYSIWGAGRLGVRILTLLCGGGMRYIKYLIWKAGQMQEWLVMKLSAPRLMPCTMLGSSLFPCEGIELFAGNWQNGDSVRAEIIAAWSAWKSQSLNGGISEYEEHEDEVYKSTFTVDGLIDFCRNHKYIYLYGAGGWGRRVASALLDRNVDYEAHLVSDLYGNERQIGDKPVQLATQVNLRRKGVGIILAMGEIYHAEVIAELDSLGCREYIAYCPSKAVKPILKELSLKERSNHVRKFAAQGYRVGILLSENLLTNNTNYRYRGYNVCQNSNRYSHRWRFVCFSQDEIDTVQSLLPLVQCVTLLRLLWNFEIEELIAEARCHHVSVLYSMDDMLFLPEHAVRTLENSRAEGKIFASSYNYFSVAGRAHILMEKADGLLATTTHLQKMLMQEFAKPCYVLRNFLNEEQLAVLQSNKKRPGFWLGYFPGTATHGLDFACCAKAIKVFMEKYDDVCLRIVGSLELPEDLKRFGAMGRVEELPLVDFLELQGLMSEMDVNLAPLLVDDFTNCKSELKFFEAAIMRTVTCASPTQTFKECIADNVNGFLCCTEEDWYKKLSYLYLNPERIVQIADAAYNYALNNYSGPNVTEQIERAYDSFAWDGDGNVEQL